MARPSSPAGTTSPAPAPAAPRLPAALEPAILPDHELADEASFQRVAFEIDLSGRTAASVEFAQCRFPGADMSRSKLRRAWFGDCRLERANLANLHADESSMQRVRLTASRMTGLHWIDGPLRNVVVSQCRADLSVFRFTNFHRTTFEDCNLSRADFQNADLRGAQFVGCDLSGAQFSQARLAGARFRNCVLDGIGGITSFAGARVAGQDLVALSYTLAAGLGIEIEDTDSTES